VKKVLFDARELQHPLPLERGVEHLTELTEESYLYMLHRKNPIPLLQVAQQHGYETLSHEDSDGNWHIVITRAKDIKLQELLDV
jgi:hypothetical protein